MTAHGSADLARIKEAFVEILVRKRAELSATDDDPVESIAALFAEPAPDAAVTARRESMSPQFREFLDAYGGLWKGKDETWPTYRAWMLQFAMERGVLAEATRFLDNAEKESDRVGYLARYGVTLRAASRKAAGNGKEDDAPTADADGRPVETVLSTHKESDTTGDYFWVRIDGEVGKLYADTLVFEEAEHQVLARIPTTDRKGRRILKVLPDRKGDQYVVLIGNLWGLLDDDGGFVPTHPDDDAFADWSKRQLVDEGYLSTDTGGDTPVAGRWFKPWQNKEFYLFAPHSGGDPEWAKGTDTTAAGTGATVGTTGRTIKVLLKDKARPYRPDRL